MSWPLPQDFNEAIQNPATVFTDPDLKGGQAIVGPTGLPLPQSGNFADVYQVRGADGRDWAVKCFTRPVFGLESRYDRVAEALAEANLPFGVEFTYLEQGIRVRGAWRPAVKMEWVEGLTLNHVVEDNLASQKVLSGLVRLWAKMCQRLRDAKIAHADLQHGNVLLVPGSQPGKYGLKLIDYDGMYVPALAEHPSGEAGHPNYQHPRRAETRAYSPDLDKFPHLVVATALKALEISGPSLWHRYDTGDNLLFVEKDFKDPSASPLMKELWATGHPTLQALVGRLAVSCDRHIARTPWLDEVLPESEPLPLDPDDFREADVLLGVSAAEVVAAVPVVEAVMVPEAAAEPGYVDAEPVPARPKAGTRESKSRREDEEEPEERKLSPVLLIVIGVGAILLAGGAVGGVLMLRGKNSDAAESVRPSGPLSLPGPVLVPGGPSPDRPRPRDTNRPKQKDNGNTFPDDPRGDEKAGPAGPPPPLTPTKEPVPELKPRWIVASATQTTSGPGVMAFDSASETLFCGATSAKGFAAFDVKAGGPRTGFTLPPKLMGPVARIYAIDSGLVEVFIKDDPNILVWNTKTGKTATGFRVPQLPPNEAVSGFPVSIWISPNGRYLAMGQSGTPAGDNVTLPFRVFDGQDNGRSIFPHPWKGGSVHFTADSSRVLIASFDGKFRWCDLPDRRREIAITLASRGDDSPHVVGGISGDGRVIGYVGIGHTARGVRGGQPDPMPRLLDGSNGADLLRFDPQEYDLTTPPVVSADGRLAAVKQSSPVGGRTVFDLVEVTTGTTISRASVQPVGPGTFCIFSPDNRLLAVYTPANNGVTLFDLTAGMP
jgi:hypothetical protein